PFSKRSVPIAPSASSGPCASRSRNGDFMRAWTLRAGPGAFNPRARSARVRRVKAPIGVVTLALLAPALGLAGPSVPTTPPSELRPGQKAIVRTVFAGDSAEAFEAEIVGIVPGGRAEGDLILARAPTPRVGPPGVERG